MFVSFHGGDTLSFATSVMLPNVQRCTVSPRELVQVAAAPSPHKTVTRIQLVQVQGCDFHKTVTRIQLIQVQGCDFHFLEGVLFKKSTS